MSVPASKSTNYPELLERAKANPQAVDFTGLRMSFARSSGYRPYAGYPNEEEPLGHAMESKDWNRILQIVNASLEKNYVRMRPHYFAAIAYEHLGDTDRARFHRAFFSGLAQSIVASGDGRSPETAIVVIDVEEEYDVLALRRLKRQSQALVEKGGRHFDRFEVSGADSSESFVLYFDVTLPFSNAPFRPKSE